MFILKSSINSLITKILSIEASPEDIISFSEWLSVDENNRDEFRRLKSYWDAQTSFNHNINLELSFEKTLRKIHGEQNTGKKKR